MTESVRWELGSMFHWEHDFVAPLWPLFEPSVRYLLCRHAIGALCAAQPEPPVLWLPTFFCPEVAHFCKCFAHVREYRDDCRWPEPCWQTLRPRANDLVLAVNYFGVRSPQAWNDWKQRHPCILVEDHTQDPFSAWALQSVAEYAVCSMRKTVPIADGAILWSPAKLVLPRPPSENHWVGSMLKAGAMVYKRSYLRGTIPADYKTHYRALQLEGELKLAAAGISAMSPVSEAILSRGVPKRWRELRCQNARTLLKALEGWKVAARVFTGWPEGHAPFDVPLVFQSREARDGCQRGLRELNIFCPVEWVCDTADSQATELSSRILSVPIDHRYCDEDIQQLANALLTVQIPG